MEGREVGNTERYLGCFLRQCTEVENTGNRTGLGENIDLVLLTAFRMRLKDTDLEKLHLQIWDSEERSALPWF